MDRVREAWGRFLSRVYNFLVEIWTRFYEGVTGDWNVRTFLVVISIVVVLSGMSLWRRRA